MVSENKKNISLCYLISSVIGSSYARTYKSYSDFNSKANDCLEIVVKHYPQSLTGMSTQVHNSIPGDQFYIHGTVGKGLQLNSKNSDGLNIIFVGGTGILPFMDLFAYILRQLVSQNEPKYEMFPGERFEDLSPSAMFVIYAYFPTRADAIGLSLIQKIEELHKK